MKCARVERAVPGASPCGFLNPSDYTFREACDFQRPMIDMTTHVWITVPSLLGFLWMAVLMKEPTRGGPGRSDLPATVYFFQ